MSTLRMGCDLCHITAIEQMLKEGPAALERMFTPEERRYSASQTHPAQHLAGFFAAKEALAKAVREPSLLGKYYREVTVCHRENGTPDLRLSESLAKVFSNRGIRVADLSISHDGDYAVAAVLVEQKPLRCGQCSMSLAALQEQRIADLLIQVTNKDGQDEYRCPVCIRGW